jgi:hypothetical protein
METYSRLHRVKRFQQEASFALGAVHGCLETLEAIGHTELEETLRAVARAAAPPDQVELAVDALSHWLGRSGHSSTEPDD